jgi:hypothetical protein
LPGSVATGCITAIEGYDATGEDCATSEDGSHCRILYYDLQRLDSLVLFITRRVKCLPLLLMFLMP